MQSCQRCCKVLRMHDLVRWFLIVHLPAHGWRRWWRNEEQFVRLWERQVLIAGVEGCVQAKVHSDAAAHDLLAVYLLTYCDGRVDIEERHYDSAEGLEGCPGVDG